MTTRKQDIILPPGVATVGLSEQELARVWGISPTQLADLDPKLKPLARRVGGRKLYSYIEAMQRFHELPLWNTADANDDEWRLA